MRDSHDKVLEGDHYVCQHLGDPIFVDAASIASYAHWPRWIWTNFTLSSSSTAAFFGMPSPLNQEVDDILDPNRISLPVVRDELPLLALVHKMGAPRRVFPTFIMFHSHLLFAIGGRVGCGMLTPKSTPKHWLTNGSVPWDFALAPPQLLACFKANYASCWAKPWIFIPWCGLLGYAFHCKGIVVVLGGRGSWLGGTTVHIQGQGKSRHGWRSRTNLSIQAVCNRKTSVSTFLNCFGFFACGGGFIITYRLWWRNARV